MKRMLSISVLLLVSVPAIAGAPDKQAMMAQIKAACEADIQRLCSNVMPGGGRIKDCLVSNKDQMSVGCAKALESMKEQKKN